MNILTDKIEDLFTIKNEKDEILGTLYDIKYVRYGHNDMLSGDTLRERIYALIRYMDKNF